MNIILLITLIGIEIGLVVFTVVKQAEKREWIRNRFLVNCFETLVFLLFTLFPGINFGFRFKGLLVLLVLRVIISGILFLAKRKKSSGRRKKGGVIYSAINSVFLFVCGLFVSFLFADYQGREVTGNYTVAMTEAILLDESRVEVFETDGSKREVPVHFYYPKDAAAGETFPVVLFSHGAFGYYESNTSTYMELASNGYVVISLDHPYHSFFCKDTSGKTVTVNPKFLNDVMYINSGDAPEREIAALSSEWLKLRTEDMSFVLDTLEAYQEEEGFSSAWYISEEAENVQDALAKMDMEKVGVMGHSLGGAASEVMGRTRSDVDAVIDLDGTMLGEQQNLVDCEEYEFEGIVYHEKYVINEEPYPVPIFSIDNEEHHFSRITAKENGVPYANNTVMEHALDGYDTYFKNSGHMNFTDLPLFAPALANALGTGSIDAGECVDEMNGLILEYFDSKLKDKGEFNVKESYGD